MRTTKVYKTMIGARMAILIGRIKSFFKGSHYVAEHYTLKYDRTERVYHVEHYTMTHDEKSQMDAAITIKQNELIRMAEEMKTEMETVKDNTAPKMNAKPKQKPKAKKIDTNIDTDKIVKDIKDRGAYNGEPKPKKKYYHNKNKKKNQKKAD